MLVKNGLIDNMFIEPNVPGDQFKVSGADTMLGYINLNARTPQTVSLIIKPGGKYCAKAKAMPAERAWNSGRSSWARTRSHEV